LNFPDPVSGEYVVTRTEKRLSGSEVLELMQTVLDQGVPFRFSAKGDSMVPFILNEDILTISPLSSCKLKLGQVAAFINPVSGKLTVHRVIGIGKDEFLMQGDHLHGGVDGWVGKDCILGVVTSIERDQQKITFGLGKERYLITFLSRFGLLLPVFFRIPISFRAFLKRYL
jgi:hypothetical protein